MTSHFPVFVCFSGLKLISPFQTNPVPIFNVLKNLTTTQQRLRGLQLKTERAMATNFPLLSSLQMDPISFEISTQHRMPSGCWYSIMTLWLLRLHWEKIQFPFNIHTQRWAWSGTAENWPKDARAQCAVVHWEPSHSWHLTAAAGVGARKKGRLELISRNGKKSLERVTFKQQAWRTIRARGWIRLIRFAFLKRTNADWHYVK